MVASISANAKNTRNDGSCAIRGSSSLLVANKHDSTAELAAASMVAAKKCPVA